MLVLLFTRIVLLCWFSLSVRCCWLRCCRDIKCVLLLVYCFFGV